MEQLMNEIRAYASAMGVFPTTVIQNAGAGGGGVWPNWENGGGCSMRTADKIRAYMANNPPPQSDVGTE